MSIKFGIIFLLLIIPILLLIIAVFIVYGGENGYNKYCGKANWCSGSVRCRAKCVNEADCFIEKEKKWWEKLIWKIKN